MQTTVGPNNIFSPVTLIDCMESKLKTTCGSVWMRWGTGARVKRQRFKEVKWYLSSPNAYSTETESVIISSVSTSAKSGTKQCIYATCVEYAGSTEVTGVS